MTNHPATLKSQRNKLQQKKSLATEKNHYTSLAKIAPNPLFAHTQIHALPLLPHAEFCSAFSAVRIITAFSFFLKEKTFKILSFINTRRGSTPHTPARRKKVRFRDLAVVAVEVASAVTVHAGHEAGGGIPHGAVEVVARALAVEHARRGVVEKAGGEVGNAKHLRPQHSRLSVLTHARNSTITTARALKMCSLQSVLLQKMFF